MWLNVMCGLTGFLLFLYNYCLKGVFSKFLTMTEPVKSDHKATSLVLSDALNARSSSVPSPRGVFCSRLGLVLLCMFTIFLNICVIITSAISGICLNCIVNAATDISYLTVHTVLLTLLTMIILE